MQLIFSSQRCLILQLFLHNFVIGLNLSLCLTQLRFEFVKVECVSLRKLIIQLCNLKFDSIKTASIRCSFLSVSQIVYRMCRLAFPANLKVASTRNFAREKAPRI